MSLTIIFHIYPIILLKRPSIDTNMHFQAYAHAHVFCVPLLVEVVLVQSYALLGLADHDAYLALLLKRVDKAVGQPASCKTGY